MGSAHENQEEDHVAGLRADRQGPAGGTQCFPRQQQDEAHVPSEPSERHADFRRARPEREAARVHARASLGGTCRRPRQLALEDQRRQAVAQGPQAQERDCEEAGRSGGCGLTLGYSPATSSGAETSTPNFRPERRATNAVTAMSMETLATLGNMSGIAVTATNST